MIEDGKSKQARLGRGLSALLGGDVGEAAPLENQESGVKEIPIEFLAPNSYQPRHHFDEGELRELTASIRQNGILQPILVRPVQRDKKQNSAGATYEIIAGERRWRAAQAARLHEVPVVIREADDPLALELAIIENVQRDDLSAIEEARAYHLLQEEFGLVQEKIAVKVGKSRSHVANLLRLLSLPEEVQAMVEEGKLSMGHARALLGASNPASFAKHILKKGLNVRQTEQLIKNGLQTVVRKAPDPTPRKDADTLALEKSLTDATGLRVLIEDKGEKGGNIRIQYKTLEQLDEMCRRLCRGEE